MDFAEFETKANDNTQYKCCDKALKKAKCRHSPCRSIERKDDQNVYDGYSASSNKGNIDQYVQSDGRSDDLHMLARPV